VTGPAGEARRRTPYRIAIVCLGNICRSPMAAVVLSDRVARAGLSDEVVVVSAGTGGWHVGGPMDERAARVLTAHGYDASRHRARQFDAGWFDDCDLILAMDADNRRDVAVMAPDHASSKGLSGGGPGQVRMFRDYDPAGPGDVPDPYFGGDDGFDEVLAMVERTADALVAELLDPAVVDGRGGR
jgi:protein-tyrosine phosphatase